MNRDYYRPPNAGTTIPARRPTPAAYMALGLGIVVLACIVVIVIAAIGAVVVELYVAAR